MPSASNAKLEKQASSEASDPIKQTSVFIEHKIRNLGKKKARLDAYKEILQNGKELDADQKQALMKYDELCQNLAFAQDLNKQVGIIAAEHLKTQKKKEKKEAYEREQLEVLKVKEILIIQDLLSSLGTAAVREDFLAGRNKAVQISETELGYLDELFPEVSPKRDAEENQPPFQEQAQNAAKHLLAIVEGKDKEVFGTKYSELKNIFDKVNGCGYFDQSSTSEPSQEVVEEADPEVIQEETQDLVQSETQVIEEVPQANFQASDNMEPVVPATETAGLYISQRPVAEVLNNVMGTGPSAFSFIQESELEPEVVPVPAPIPTQTFTNASFAPPPQGEEIFTENNADVSQPIKSEQYEATITYQNASQAQPETGDWNSVPEASNDWATQSEQHSSWNESTQPNDEWADNNDGFQTAGRGGGRGGRNRGGGDRARGGRGRGTYQNNRGNNQNGRGGYYNRNNDRNSDGNNYYQNGYQSRGGDGPRRGGPRGGSQDHRGGPRSDRGGPRGNGRGQNSRGSNNRGAR